MRSLSATLLAAQKAAKRTPYVVVEYYSGGGWQSLTSAVLAATHIQEDYHSGLNVLINNRSNAYKDLSIRGCQIRIGHGFYTTLPGNEYSYGPSLWVTECGPDTRSGQNVVVIKALGIWDRLANSKPATEVKYNETSNDYTIRGIISDILYRATGQYIGTDISIDSIINTRYVKFTLSLDRSYAEQIIELLSNTECELRPDGTQLRLIRPQDADSSVYTYDSNHVISANTRRIALFKPNKVTVKSIQADGTEVSGSYTDSETGSLILYEDFKYTSSYWGITSVALCEALAQDFVERMKRRGNKGVALTKVNCGQELWDVVTLVDKWTGQNFTARVGRIEVNYSKFNDQGYMMRLGFGAWTESNGATDGGEAPAASEFIPELSGRSISPYSIEPWLLRKSMQPYDCTVQPDKTNGSYTWETVYWLAGDIFFKDGTKLSISAGSLNLTSAGYGDNPVLLYFKEGNSTLQHTSNWQTAMGWGCGVLAVIQRAETTSVKASWDAPNGKTGVLNTRLLLADMILSAHIKAGELVIGGKVTGTLSNLSSKAYSELTGQPTSLNAINATEYAALANAYTWGGYAYTGLNSQGEVKKAVIGANLPTGAYPTGAGLYVYGDYLGYHNGNGALSGWKVFIHSGGSFYFEGNASNYISWNGSILEIKGRVIINESSSQIASGYTLTVNGTLSAGGGNALMDSTGLTIKGQYLKFLHTDGALKGYVKGMSDGLYLYGYDKIVLSTTTISVWADIVMANASFKIDLRSYGAKFYPRCIYDTTFPDASVALGELVVFCDDGGTFYLGYRNPYTDNCKWIQF